MRIKNNEFIQKTSDGKYLIVVTNFGAEDAEDRFISLSMVDAKYEQQFRAKKPGEMYCQVAAKLPAITSFNMSDSVLCADLVSVDYNDKDRFFLFEGNWRINYGILFPCSNQTEDLPTIGHRKGYEVNGGYKKGDYATAPSVELLLQQYPDEKLVEALPWEYFTGKKLNSTIAALRKGLEYNTPSDTAELPYYKEKILAIKEAVAQRIAYAESFCNRHIEKAYADKEERENREKILENLEMQDEIAEFEVQDAIDSLRDFTI